MRGKNGCSGYEGRIDWTQTGSIGDGVDIDDGPVNANAGTNPRTYPFAFGHLAVNGTSDNGQLSLTLTLSDAYGGPTYPAGTEIHVLSTGRIADRQKSRATVSSKPVGSTWPNQAPRRRGYGEPACARYRRIHGHGCAQNGGSGAARSAPHPARRDDHVSPVREGEARRARGVNLEPSSDRTIERSNGLGKRSGRSGWEYGAHRESLERPPPRHIAARCTHRCERACRLFGSDAVGDVRHVDGVEDGRPARRDRPGPRRPWDRRDRCDRIGMEVVDFRLGLRRAHLGLRGWGRCGCFCRASTQGHLEGEQFPSGRPFGNFVRVRRIRLCRGIFDDRRCERSRTGRFHVGGRRNSHRQDGPADTRRSDRKAKTVLNSSVTDCDMAEGKRDK